MSTEMTMVEAFRDGIRQVFSEDDRGFVMGESVQHSLHGFTKGLVDEFGKDRIRDTPLAEQAMTGLAIGSAQTGLRPIVEIMAADWSTLSVDSLVNVAAKMRYITNGESTCPMVLYAPIGPARRTGIWHSNCYEQMFMVPGMQVLVPGTPADAKGLLMSAYEEENPVTIFLPRSRLYEEGPVPEGRHTTPFDADVKRTGEDVTLATYGSSTHEALISAERLADKGIDAEIVDVRSLLPFDDETVLESVRKTGNLVVVHEGTQEYGFAGEIMSRVVESGVDLNSPPQRIGTPFTPTPLTKDEWIQDIKSDNIVETAENVVN